MRESGSQILQQPIGELGSSILAQPVRESDTPIRAQPARELDIQITQQSIAELPWSHNVTLLETLKKTQDRLWYAKQSLEHGWSRNVLALQIESSLHLRQGRALTNFKRTLPPPQSGQETPQKYDSGDGVPRISTRATARTPQGMVGFRTSQDFRRSASEIDQNS